ncbi:hypothetical protein HY498_00805 [Candidatus Woesearchaeota archaeon]|nr:hypothetical protein [Candidatus Woesearchaeota archaeon]
MKCEACKKDVNKFDFMAMIKTGFTRYFFNSNFYFFFLLPYWWVTSQLYRQLNKNVSYMHFSCWEKKKYAEKFGIHIASSSLQLRVVPYVFFFFIFLIIILAFLAPWIKSCHYTSETFMGLFTGQAEGGCVENRILEVIPYPLYLTVVLSSLSLYFLLFISYLLARKYVTNIV